MARYATSDDLLARVGERELTQLTDRADPPAGVFDAGVAETALEDACAEIDGYLQARYAVPVSPAPAIARPLACTIARFRLHREPPDGVRKDFEAALKSLAAIAAGEISLGDAATHETVQFTGATPLLTRDQLAGF